MNKSPGAPSSNSSAIFVYLINYPLKYPGLIRILKSSFPGMILLPLQVEHLRPTILPLPEHLGHGFVIML